MLIGLFWDIVTGGIRYDFRNSTEEEVEAVKKANPGDEAAALADVLEKRK